MKRNTFQKWRFLQRALVKWFWTECNLKHQFGWSKRWRKKGSLFSWSRFEKVENPLGVHLEFSELFVNTPIEADLLWSLGDDSRQRWTTRNEKLFRRFTTHFVLEQLWNQRRKAVHTALNTQGTHFCPTLPKTVPQKQAGYKLQGRTPQGCNFQGRCHLQLCLFCFSLLWSTCKPHKNWFNQTPNDGSQIINNPPGFHTKSKILDPKEILKSHKKP